MEGPAVAVAASAAAAGVAAVFVAHLIVVAAVGEAPHSAAVAAVVAAVAAVASAAARAPVAAAFAAAETAVLVVAKASGCCGQGTCQIQVCPLLQLMLPLLSSLNPVAAGASGLMECLDELLPVPLAPALPLQMWHPCWPGAVLAQFASLVLQ